MHASEVTPEAVERANVLYWDSGQSVNQIAEELDLSKGTLYGVIRPQPSGLGCPLCGSEVGYPNRTAKEKGSLECPTCAWDGTADEATGDVDPEAPPGSGDIPYAAEGPTDLGTPGVDGQPMPVPPRPLPDLSVALKGALIGGTVGLLLVLWARRR